MSIKEKITGIARNARRAGNTLANISSDVKNRALLQMAEELVRQTDYLVSENAKDLDYADKKGLSAAMIDRLTLNDLTIKGFIKLYPRMSPGLTFAFNVFSDAIGTRLAFSIRGHRR